MQSASNIVSCQHHTSNQLAFIAEVFSSSLAIVSAVMVGGLFLVPALRYGTGYQTVWEIRSSADSFKRSLKTFLFSAYSCTEHIRAFWTIRSTNLLTYFNTFKAKLNILP